MLTSCQCRKAGNAKPFSTYAGFTMLRLHGAINARGGRFRPRDNRSHGIPAGSFFPSELAVKLPTFRGYLAEAVNGAEPDREQS